MGETTERGARERGQRRSSSWSLQIATILGIPIRIHFTFLLLLVWFWFTAPARGETPGRAIAFVLLVFACVAAHELGHAAVARRFGIRTRDIVLYPIGGVAQLEKIPAGRAELWISLAGPAVNLLIAAILTGLLLAGDSEILPRLEGGRAVMSLPQQLLVANLILVVFNLIPAFPMDGGRVLRAALTMVLQEGRATAIAAGIGQVIAVALGLWGVVGSNWILVFIAVFVFLGAGQEAAFHRQKAVVVGRTTREAMITRFETLAPQDSLARAAEHLLATHQQDFPVLDAWQRVAGVLSRRALLEGLAREGTGGAVLSVMRRDPPSVSPDADLAEVLRILQSEPSLPVLVVEDGRLAGMITLENLSEFIEVSRIESAARG